MYTITGFWHGAATLSGRIDLSQALATHGHLLDRCTDQQLKRSDIHSRHIHRLRTSQPLSSCQDSLLLGQPTYPSGLGVVPFAPPVLFFMGNQDLLSETCVAIVGARRCTQRGIDTARSLAHGLTQAGCVVVSGLAYGIDTAAHLARPDKTIAVLGQGIEQAINSQKRKIIERIVSSGGLVLSEFPPKIPASRYTFPQRNRIISGLCDGTVVVEATMRSGTRITARQTLEQGRELMVVPGHPSDRTSTGCNTMLMEGAALIRDADDVLQCLGREVLSKQKRPLPSCSHQVRVISALDTGDTFDHIVQCTGLGQSEVSVALAALELTGWIQRLPGDRVTVDTSAKERNLYADTTKG